jgi:nicotinamide riboside transporter PnuC
VDCKIGGKMRLSAPKKITWWIAVIVGVIGTIGLFVTLPVIGKANAPYLVVFGFVLLALATYLKGL